MASSALSSLASSALYSLASSALYSLASSALYSLACLAYNLYYYFGLLLYLAYNNTSSNIIASPANMEGPMTLYKNISERRICSGADQMR